MSIRTSIIKFFIRYSDRKIKKLYDEIDQFIPRGLKRYNINRDEYLLQFETDQIKWWVNFRLKCYNLL